MFCVPLPAKLMRNWSFNINLDIIHWNILYNSLYIEWKLNKVFRLQLINKWSWNSTNYDIVKVIFFIWNCSTSFFLNFDLKWSVKSVLDNVYFSRRLQMFKLKINISCIQGVYWWFSCFKPTASLLKWEHQNKNKIGGDPQPRTQDPQPATHDSRPTTLDPRPRIHEPQPTTHDPRPTTRNPRPVTPNLRPKTC